MLRKLLKIEQEVKVIFKDTRKAFEFLKWMSGSGEQDYRNWMESRPMADDFKYNYFEEVT